MKGFNLIPVIRQWRICQWNVTIIYGLDSEQILGTLENVGLGRAAFNVKPFHPDSKNAMHTGELPNWQFHYYVPYAPAMHPFPQPSAVIGLKMGSMVYIKGHSCLVFVHIEVKCAKKMDL